jgi:hypothetical protein
MDKDFGSFILKIPRLLRLSACHVVVKEGTTKLSALPH